MKFIILFTILGLLVSHCGTTQKNTGSEAKKPVLTVSILPQEYFVRRIVGNNPNFVIQVMIPPGQSPETYAPTPLQMKTVSQSSLYLQIGHIPFETAWTVKYGDSQEKDNK